MNSFLNWSYKLGCINCAACIITGAAGGHKPWPNDQKEIFQKAVLYHFMNGIGMIVASLSPQSIYATICFQAGVFVFCVPLYHRAFTGDKKLSSILPPFGGIAMIVGWLLLALRK